MTNSSEKNIKPAPSGETRGTPEKVCDWKAVGWTIDPKILGEIEDDPRVRAEGDPGLEMVEAILLAADWKPLAPEATTKEQCGCCGCPRRNCIHDDCSECHGKRFNTVAPGEAVGRETREQSAEEFWRNDPRFRAPNTGPWTDEETKKMLEWGDINPFNLAEAYAEHRLSTLRRERDQWKEGNELWYGNWEAAAATSLANQKRAAELESQVPPSESTSTNALKVMAELLVNILGEKYELESEVAELRAAVEKLKNGTHEALLAKAEAEEKATIINSELFEAKKQISKAENLYNHLYERTMLLERELSDMRKGSL